MEQRLSLVTLGVKNLPEARAFFGRLGWKESGASNAQVAFFQIGGLAFGLFGRDDLAADIGVASEGSGFSGVTLAYNVREKRDVDAMLSEAERAGARILKPAREVFWGGYSGYFADPEGYVWEVAWNPGFPINPDGTLTLPE